MNLHAVVQRRAVLQWGASLTTLLLLAGSGCQPQTDSGPVAAALRFHGMDITGLMPDASRFALTDHDGKERTLADFAGHAVLIFFGFTQCPDVCPMALARASEIKQLLGDDGQRLQVLFVTLDPERDTPDILKAYTTAFDPAFLGLYGDLERTQATARNFKVYFKKVPTGSSYTLDHTALSYVYDPDGVLRLALRHNQSATECAQDIRQLLRAT